MEGVETHFVVLFETTWQFGMMVTRVLLFVATHLKRITHIRTGWKTEQRSKRQRRNERDEERIRGKSVYHEMEDDSAHPDIQSWAMYYRRYYYFFATPYIPPDGQRDKQLSLSLSLSIFFCFISSPLLFSLLQ